MPSFKEQIQKLSLLGFAAAAIGIANINPLQAQSSSDAILQQIAANTKGILDRVDTLPAFLSKITASMLSLTSADPDPDNKDSKAVIGDFQGSFVNIANNLIVNSSTQDALQPILNTRLMTDPVSGNPISTSTLSNINDLTYSTLIGAPYVANDPRGKNVNAGQNYIINASGITLYHTPPAGWRGSAQSQVTYRGYYNTLMAAESFNAYILSDMYANSQNPGGTFNTLQTALIKQASDPTNWFAQISSENIGQVIRQMLMFESQSYVLLSEMLKTEKQMLYAQAMTNSLIIATNASNEDTLLRRAQGSMPPGG